MEGATVGDMEGRTEEGLEVVGFNEGTLVGGKVGIKVVGIAVRMGCEIGCADGCTLG